MKPKTFTLLTMIALVYSTTYAQWSLTGNAGTNSSTNFVGTTDNSSLKLRTANTVRMVIGNTGSVGIGTAVSSISKFSTTGAVGNTTALFGTGTTGVSLQQSYPGISFNSYYNAGYKALATGYGANITLDPTNGNFIFRTISNGAAAGSVQTYKTVMVISNFGSVGIGNSNPSASVNLQIGSSTGSRIQIGDQSQLLDNGNMRLAVSSTFEPTADGVYHLGGSSTRWADVWSVDGSINTSDARDKSNIRDMSYGLKDILKLHPVVFNWKDAPERGDKLGLIAQELQTVIKEAVISRTFTTDEKGAKSVAENSRLGVFYNDLVPVMIKAIQEQQAQIGAKDATIESLQSKITLIEDRLSQMEQMVASIKTTGSSVMPKMAQLYQNTPNPFNDKSAIRFYIPNNAVNAELKIFSNDGKEVKRIKVAARGENKIDLAAGMLPAGVYNYSLFVDGKLAASKQMILVQ